MEKSRRPRWLRWVLRTPIALAILGFGAMIIAERRIDSEIEKEVDLLLRIGIDVRPVSPVRDAGMDYQSLVRRMKTVPSGASDSEEILVELERLSAKPYATFDSGEADFFGTYGDLRTWLDARMLTAIKAKNYSLIRRLLAVYWAFEAQAENPFSSGYCHSLRAVENYRGEDPQVFSWFRMEYESRDFSRLVCARLASIGREYRFIRHEDPGRMRPGSHVVVHPSNPIKAWWMKVVESQTAFRKATELVALQSLRRVAQRGLNKPGLEMLSTSCRQMVNEDLLKQKSWQAKWLAENVGASYYPAYKGELLDVHVMFIKLDLIESRALGRPLQPTWSQKYCVDPDSKSQLKVVATPRRITLSSSSGTYEVGW